MRGPIGLSLMLGAWALAGCVASRPAAPASPVEESLESSWPGPHPCRSGAQCADGRCLQELPGVCGESAPVSCLGDDQCGDGMVCWREASPCGNPCVPRCQGASCGPGARCRPDGHCQPIPCTESPRCAPHEECVASAVSESASGCVARRCAADRDCAPGVCIDGACAPHLGVCYGGPCRGESECGGTRCKPPSDERGVVERYQAHGCHADVDPVACAAEERCAPVFTDEPDGQHVALSWRCLPACGEKVPCEGACVDGICRPLSCRDGFVCPGHLACDSAQSEREVGAPASIWLRHDCARKECRSDEECGSGACVEGTCYARPGSCWNAPAPKL